MRTHRVLPLLALLLLSLLLADPVFAGGGAPVRQPPRNPIVCCPLPTPELLPGSVDLPTLIVVILSALRPW